jgi:acetyltransferase-like isoleucine patch superfamily enzyme
MTLLRKALCFPSWIIFFGARVWRRIWMRVVKFMFKECGRNVIFDPRDSFTYSTIVIGEDVFIGSGAVFHASESAIIIGNKVMFGPRVIIMGGDHNTAEVGRYMFDVKEKRSRDDLPVVIEDDVWVGAGSIILKGVAVGRGSIVGAGSVVTRSVPEFSVVTGVPAKFVRQRFGPEELSRHKDLLKL